MQIMRFRRILLMVLSVLLVLGASSSTWAAPTWKDRAEAKKLFNKGVKHDKAEEWQEAREAFQSSIDLNETASARYHLAKALANLGLFIEAREHAQVVADNNRAGWWNRKHSQDLLKTIEEKLPHIKVSVPPDFEGTVRLDGKLLSHSDYGSRMEINPGSVVIRAESQGFLPFEETIVLAEGADETVSIKLEPEPEEETEEGKAIELSTSDGSTSRTLGYVSLAVGGVGVVAGTVFGVMARNTREDLRAACVDDVCSENQRDAYDRGKMQANISTVGFVVGGVGLGLGAVLLLTGPKDQEEAASTAHVQPWVGPTGAGLSGRF